MLKYAYQVGVLYALREAGMTKTAEGSTWLPATLGGVGGAGVGGVLGGLGGMGLARAADIDDEKAVPLGVLLGGLTGAGLGGYGGHLLGKHLNNPKDEAGNAPDWYRKAHPHKFTS